MGRKTDSDVHGVLLLDKPAGPTSHDLVARVRRALKTRRVGHAGTLDPFATGLLVCCVGRATRLVRFLTGSEKRYEAVARFGFDFPPFGQAAGSTRSISATQLKTREFGTTTTGRRTQPCWRAAAIIARAVKVFPSPTS